MSTKKKLFPISEVPPAKVVPTVFMSLPTGEKVTFEYGSSFTSYSKGFIYDDDEALDIACWLDNEESDEWSTYEFLLGLAELYKRTPRPKR